MFSIDNSLGNLRDHIEAHGNESEFIETGNLFDEVERDAQSMTEKIKSIVFNMEYNQGRGMDRAFGHVKGMDDLVLDEYTLEVLDRVLEAIQNEVRSELEDLVIPGSRLED